MTYQAAIEGMKTMAGDRAWSLMYETTSYFLEGPVKITGYIAGPGHGLPANTYEGAIIGLKAKLNSYSAPIPDPPPDDLAEIPQIEPITKRCVTVDGT